MWRTASLPYSATATPRKAIDTANTTATSTARSSSERHHRKALGGQSVGESGERAEVEFFTTDVRIEGKRGDRRGDAFARKIERERKRVRQGLAPVRERTAHDLFEPAPIADARGRSRQTMKYDDGGHDAGAGGRESV